MGDRLRWGEVPEPVRRAVAGRLGAEVRAEDSRPGGFSPGVASRLTLADGRRVFVKAVNAGRNPMAPQLHRREAEVMRYLPPTAAVPRLLDVHDDGDWVVLVIEDVDGQQPTLPWRTDQLARVMSALERLAQVLTPAPPTARPFTDAVAEEFTGWQFFAGTPGAADVLDRWVLAHLDRLAGMEADLGEAAAGDTLLHGDLRADNLLLTGDGSVVVVDWPHAGTGAPWCDLLFMLPSVAAAGGIDPQAVWLGFGPARRADPVAVDVVLIALTGYFLYRSTLPAPMNIARVRQFQQVQGQAALRWMGRRLGIGPDDASGG